MIKKNLSKDEVIRKIKQYCNYRERCHSEVKQKLYSFGLYKSMVEEIIALLIEEDHLNEERFAKQYVSGKFKMKQWGRVKIEYGLKQKQVSKYNIQIALKQIDNESYLQGLQKLTREKWALLKHEQYINRQAKTMNYLIQKGYEPRLISEAIKELREK